MRWGTGRKSKTTGDELRALLGRRAQYERLLETIDEASQSIGTWADYGQVLVEIGRVLEELDIKWEVLRVNFMEPEHERYRFIQINQPGHSTLQQGFVTLQETQLTQVWTSGDVRVLEKDGGRIVDVPSALGTLSVRVEETQNAQELVIWLFKRIVAILDRGALRIADVRSRHNQTLGG